MRPSRSRGAVTRRAFYASEAEEYKHAVSLDYSSEEKVALVKLLTVFKGLTLRTGLNYSSEEKVALVKLLTLFEDLQLRTGLNYSSEEKVALIKVFTVSEVLHLLPIFQAVMFDSPSLPKYPTSFPKILQGCQARLKVIQVLQASPP